MATEQTVSIDESSGIFTDDWTPTTSEFLARIIQELGEPYRLVVDVHFQWATPFGNEQHAQYAQQAAHGLRRVRQAMPGLMPPPAEGWPAILFASVDTQLAYQSLFGGGEGAHIINGGMWCSWPVGHLAVPVIGGDALDAAFGHELVHAMLSGTGVPTWLQEGLATELETCMGNRRAPLDDMYRWKQTLAWWRSHDPETFWDASAFRNPESSRHAYDLAQVMALRFSGRPERLHRIGMIGRTAWRTDQDAVLREVLGGDRAQLFAAVVAGQQSKNWIERFLYWCFVGDRP
jgi:hypothetical protein